MPPTRLPFGFAFGSLLLPVTLACAPGDPQLGPAPDAPNIVLITIDTLRADALGAYGNPNETSPFLDVLATEGLVFADALAQCGTTPQSLSSLMTGLYPYSDGIIGANGPFVYLERGNPTLASILSEHGFRTHAITASLQSSVMTGIDLGFQSFDGIAEDAQGKLLRRSAEEITDRALEWLAEERPEERPFFLWVHYLDPHQPYRSPPGYRRLFGTDPADEGTSRAYRFDSKQSSSYAVTDGELERLRLEYLREVRFTDDHVRRLFEEGLDDLVAESVIVFTADHGEALGEHAIIGHNDLYRPILRVPLLLRLPGEAAPRGRVEQPVMLVDVLPTLMAQVGIDPPPGRGRPLTGFLQATGDVAPRLRLSEYADQRAIELERYKLIERPAGREFYSLEPDPDELENHAGRTPDLERKLLQASRRLIRNPLGVKGSGAARPEATDALVDELRALGY